MLKNAKKKDSEKKLPKFKANTLGIDELCQIKGGMPPETANTQSVCHVDGTCDGAM
ncbi:hypothetical protein [Nannocystis punicea]|uniref:Uncharacterized protein n=1 Tax=Nannocystis punicea TaxID=2995304 RepID=A0ABY7H909_9BACT|nr:hypothetical protein [Nannocystis poenicansa]WAS95757.1 hypothetical protein O0S08_06305 [Nannocystis poenicansa]